MANLRVAELDFDAIKQNLKDYLQAQSEFTDYDFEGSGMSVLLDILAYNTHYNAYLANMLVNEMFLDSAVKRSSAVSIAKHLGYTPRSAKCSTAVVNITAVNPAGTPVSLTLDRYTPFTTSIGDVSYTFLNTESKTISPVNGVYLFSNVSIKQGTLLEYSYTIANPGPQEKFEIPNNNVDTSTLFVTVQTSSSDVSLEVFNFTEDLSGLTSTSSVYFLEESPTGKHQIYFGDGVFGKKLTAGNIVTVKYLVTEGTVANVNGDTTQNFSSEVNIGNSDNIVVTTVSNSTGGADKEGIDSIKFNAPLSNNSRFRAVTKEDYSFLIKSNFPIIDSVLVWGGEDNEPPVYGKVYISLKPSTGFFISQDVKNNILSFLKDGRQVLTVQPEIIDPDYLYIRIECDVKYNNRITTKNNSQIESTVITAVNNYFNNNLGEYNQDFYASKLSEAINDSDSSIISNICKFYLQKRIDPILNTPNAFIVENSLKFNNSLEPGTLTSTKFFVTVDTTTYAVEFRDVPSTMPPDNTGSGTLYLYDLDNATYLNDLGTFGTINYLTGEVSITSFNPSSLLTDQFDIRITAELQPDSIDVTVQNNQIIVLDDSRSNINSNRNAGLAVSAVSIR